MQLELGHLQRINLRQYLDECSFSYSTTRVPGIVTSVESERSIIDYRANSEGPWGSVKTQREYSEGCLVWVYISPNQNMKSTDSPINSNVVAIESMESND
jgi:hypothetical protein